MVKIQLKGLTILSKKTCDTENGGERDREIKNWNPKLSLSLLTNPNLFLQEYSIPLIQATGLFFNSIFFQFKIHVFVSCSLYYWIPQIFKFFWKIRFESIFVCVCVCMENGTDSEEFVLLSRVRNEGAIRDLRVLGSDPSDIAI